VRSQEKAFLLLVRVKSTSKRRRNMRRWRYWRRMGSRR
jgi:hypothetical protein